MENNCIFCDRRNFEERLIHESENFYVIATLGQITDGGYVLLFPKEHIPCFASLPDVLLMEFFENMVKIGAGFEEEYGIKLSSSPTIFEHGIVGQSVKHAHLHFLPTNVSMRITEKVRRDFPTAEIDEIDGLINLMEVYARKPEPYLSWVTSDQSGKLMVCWSPTAPLQYLRTVAAEILGRPERANWRTMDPELDRKLWSETVTRLKPYFL